ncbi:hypothetical protein BGZ95_001251 [Linnemannia exigua]|uniref:Uncharacterized protein n=1 Tax=Linnemannia exigua TaxID=604196 RepID=A0AAD4DJ82_9FUNG|nr:hypothetical protein BGZ95_001251 [Linnemannia exigua]
MASVTPLTQDHLHFRGEINPEESHDLRPHGQWTSSSQSECSGQLDAGYGTSREDGLRLKDPIVRGMGRERKRSTGAVYDGTSSDRKRRKNQPDWGLKQNSSTITTTSTETAAHLLRFLEKRFEQRCPASTSAEIASHHPNWVESVKKRKIHQYATKWTSALSPAPYVRLLGLRNFWEMMEPRQDLSWKSEDDTQFGQDDDKDEDEDEGVQGQNKAKKESLEMDIENDSTLKSARLQSARRRNSEPSCVRTVKQYPCPGHFLRGLWEEELRNQRVRQMIPDTVRKPIRGKIYHAKPIMNMNKQNKPTLPSLFTGSSSSSNSSSTEGATAGQDSNMDDTNDEAEEAKRETTSAVATTTATTTPMTEFELSLKKKHRAAAIIRSHAITEGSDMSEYKPWKDGTVTPRQGSLQGLKASRSNIMDPWPVEEAKSKDECMRVLHRMREQLNIVINLQIHLRSMMKTAPGQWSFLLSIRHPGQVSIELLLALYGPHFMQTSNFRAIEELLWGAKGHSQQVAATSSSSIDTA